MTSAAAYHHALKIYPLSCEGSCIEFQLDEPGGAEIMAENFITEQHVADYQRDGVTVVRGLFAHLVDSLQLGVEKNLANPGIYAAENTADADSGRFFDDYCNWQRIGEFEAAGKDPRIAAAAAAVMQSGTVQLFHDHVLVKEPGTSKPTPWHQDSPYYCVEGEQTVSFWVPLDPVSEASALRCVAGSHRWDKLVTPIRWLNQEAFYGDNTAYQPVPDPDTDGMPVLQWSMQPGDAVAFHFRVLHGAAGNASEQRRRAFSLRVVGDDARYVARPGKTSPPFQTGCNMAIITTTPKINPSGSTIP